MRASIVTLFGLVAGLGLAAPSGAEPGQKLQAPEPGNPPLAAKKISGSVGKGGKNKPADTRTVQELLNASPKGASGPAHPGADHAREIMEKKKRLREAQGEGPRTTLQGKGD